MQRGRLTETAKGPVTTAEGGPAPGTGDEAVTARRSDTLTPAAATCPLSNHSDLAEFVSV